jgi:predicted DNA binding CopG/RHH family protein
MNNKSKLPEFKDEDELAAWVESHDTSGYMDELEELGDEFEVVRTRFSTKPLDVRMRTEHLEAIEELAERRGLPYQALVQRWLLERLSQEAPDLVTK